MGLSQLLLKIFCGKFMELSDIFKGIIGWSIRLLDLLVSLAAKKKSYTVIKTLYSGFWLAY